MKLAKLKLLRHAGLSWNDVDIYVSALALWKALRTGHRPSIALYWQYRHPLTGGLDLGRFEVSMFIDCDPMALDIELTDDRGRAATIVIHYPTPQSVSEGLKELEGDRLIIHGRSLCCPELQDLHLMLEGGLQQAVILIALRDPRVTAALT